MGGVFVLAAAGCSSSHPNPAATTTPPSSASSSSAPAVDPLTGGTPNANPVLGVKVDDTASGRPQVGIDRADIVYIEAAEGGLTRLLGIFHTTLPRVEAVRSTRTSDPELALQYGTIGYVISGGAPVPLSTLDRSGLHADVADRGAPGFTRDANRPAPYNLIADLSAIAGKLKPPAVKDVGFAWSTAIANTGAQPGTQVKTVVGSTPVLFAWNTATSRYQRVIDGAVQKAADGHVIATPNVVVQFCNVTTDTKDVDVAGHPAQYTHSIGSGRAVVFRGGQRVDGTWTRTGITDGTHFVDANGKPIALAPGGAWIILVATGAPLS